jgi:PhzF family phenazine biosynthesis protein
MSVGVKLVKAFSKDPANGNPAGVVQDANNLSDEQMLKIAQHYGFSESAFVQKSSKADFKVRFFSVNQEVDLCGHATVATFYSLLKDGFIDLNNQDSVTVKQETGIGILPVTLYKDGKIMMTQKDPVFGAVVDDRANMAQLLGLAENDLSNTPIQIVSTGVKKLIVPLISLEVMRKIKPDFKAIILDGQNKDYSGIAVVTTESFSGDADLATRNFNPRVGINEDPATGIAAGPLGCYADKYILKGKKNLVIEQGFDMGKASTLLVDINNGVTVGGYAAEFGDETLEQF